MKRISSSSRAPCGVVSSSVAGEGGCHMGEAIGGPVSTVSVATRCAMRDKEE